MPREQVSVRTASESSDRAGHAAWPPALLFTSVIVLGVVGIARWGTVVIVLELLAAAVVLGPCVLLGSLLVPMFRLGEVPFSQHLSFAATLGLGFVCLAVLGAGTIGFLSRWAFAAVLILGAMAGAVHLGTVWRGRQSLQDAPIPRTSETELIRWAWVMPCLFLVLALCAAGTAPGLIWSEEGFGYDVLEYHLQVPKEYFLTGGIRYLPHNVYANFPGNVEMLYLQAMLLLGEVQEAAVTANYIHLLLGALTVYAGWAVARPWGRLAGLVSAVLLGTSGWLVYLSGLAYVEHGLLLFGVASTGAALRMFDEPEGGGNAESPKCRNGEIPSNEAKRNRSEALECVATEQDRHGGVGQPAGTRIGNWAFLAGVLAGLACGCKYTAVAFIAAPIALMAGLAPAPRMSRRAVHVLIFFLGVTISFSPWLIKNLVFTGNPVFPLANGLFQASPAGWDGAAQALWNSGHASSEMSVGERLAALWWRIPADHYGRFPWVAILLGILALWQRRIALADIALGLMLLLQVSIWLFGTHLFARFAVPMLIPLVLLSGRFVRGPRPMRAQRVRIGALAIGAVFHLIAMGRLYNDEWPGVVPPTVFERGDVSGAECIGAANRGVSPGGKIALLGEARAFYFTASVDYWTTFNRNPLYDRLLETKAGAGQRDAGTVESTSFTQWLAERGYSHVYVDWSEVRRLARSYGSNPAMTEAELGTLLAPNRGRGLVPMCSVKPSDAHHQTATPPIELFVVEP